MQLYRATLLHTRATKLREKIAGVTSVLHLLQIGCMDPAQPILVYTTHLISQPTIIFTRSTVAEMFKKVKPTFVIRPANVRSIVLRSGKNLSVTAVEDEGRI